MEKEIISDYDLKVLEVLKQIEKLNQMIDFHTTSTGDDLSREQYEFLKERAVAELQEALSIYKIEVHAMIAA
ncbi:hypothetical protein EMA8858_02858 [Emticicia aquatica]|jgi:hypothetical protein|uniref:Uncharacterized protein n=1 Tax=Emticicia aquatica TaxID=1681835 RepID=A0ABM9AT86_9BACT|nr:hypothetical protein [Emticicia aquatica]CAH0996723.1 hypothetical protein EMA8858_02858 [Emticicia aquatica]